MRMCMLRCDKKEERPRGARKHRCGGFLLVCLANESGLPAGALASDCLPASQLAACQQWGPPACPATKVEAIWFVGPAKSCLCMCELFKLKLVYTWRPFVHVMILQMTANNCVYVCFLLDRKFNCQLELATS